MQWRRWTERAVVAEFDLPSCREWGENCMPGIDGRSRYAFREAANTVLDNFTVGELADFERMAAEIADIIKRAQLRQQERLK